MIKKLPIATAGAAFLALGLVSIAPAEAAQVSKIDYEGFLTVSSPFLPIFTGQPGNTLTLPLSDSVTVDNLSGRLEDEGDSQLTIPFLSSLETYLPELFDKIPNGISLTSFSGAGSIFGDVAKTNQLSSFVWDYNPNNDILTVDGYDFSRIQPCLNGTCYIDGTGTLQSAVNVSFDLAQTTTPLGESESVPEPLTILGSSTALGFGALFKRQHSKSQKKAKNKA